MGKLITSGFVIFAALSQLAFAQNVYQNKEGDSMNKDSTSLVPIDPLNLVKPIAVTVTNVGYVSPPAPYTGQCGASHNSILTSLPTSFLCDKGVASKVDFDGTNYTWSCTGINTVSSSNVATCSAQQRVIGQCGSDNGQSVSSTPTNLCASGTPSAVSSNGTNYSWSCNGNYGAPASCSANLFPQNIKPATVPAEKSDVIWDSNMAAEGTRIISQQQYGNLWYMDGGNGYYGWLVGCRLGYKPNDYADSYNPLKWSCIKE